MRFVALLIHIYMVQAVIKIGSQWPTYRFFLKLVGG